MLNNRDLIIMLAAIFLLLFIAGCTAFGAFGFFTPQKANPDDVIFEAIGGDEFLNATLIGCRKISEENIPDGKIRTSNGEFGYYNAKNISYIDDQGRKGYIVVWKTTPDKFPFDTSENVNLYSSNYLLDYSAKSFIEYSYEDKMVYGIIIGCDDIHYTESELVYEILGLNPNGFKLSYSGSGTSTYSMGGGNTYHTVVGDRYSLSRSDPGAYYDHYEYGDNYEIDDYLEVEGYD